MGKTKIEWTEMSWNAVEELRSLWNKLIGLLGDGADWYDEEVDKLVDEIEYWFDTHPKT